MKKYPKTEEQIEYTIFKISDENSGIDREVLRRRLKKIAEVAQGEITEKDHPTEEKVDEVPKNKIDVENLSEKDFCLYKQGFINGIRTCRDIIDEYLDNNYSEHNIIK